MKSILTILLCIPLSMLSAQDIQTNIPSDASLVVEINIPEILRSLTFEELKKSSLGSEMIEDIAREIGGEVNSYADLGINTESSAYFFIDKQEDGKSNMVYLMPISDRSKIESLVGEGKDMMKDGSINYFNDGDSWIFFSDNLMSVVIVGGNPYYSEPVKPGNYLRSSNSSIMTNKEYKKQKDNEALIGMFVSDFSHFAQELSKLEGSRNEDIAPESISSIYSGYQTMSVQLFVDSDETRLEAQISFDKDDAKIYKKMANHKFNDDIFKYLDLTKCISYLTLNISVENFLLEYPAILSKQFPVIPDTPVSKDDIDLISTVLSTLLDEEAIGDILKGDLILALSGISDKEVEYIAYEYDSNFNQVPVKQTKIEKVPDFILMASTTEGDLTNKTMSFLSKKELIYKVGEYYQISSGQTLPFNLYMMIKDNLLFIGTNNAQFQSIAANRTVNNSVSEFRNHITGSQLAFYAGIKKASPYISSSDFSNEQQFTQTRDMIEKSPEIYFTLNKFKGNTSSGNITIDTPGGFENGLSYLLQLIEDFSKL